VTHSKGHWRCPDCGLWCQCTGLAQTLQHSRCGGDQMAKVDEGMRRAYESWLRAHSTPGGYSPHDA